METPAGLKYTRTHEWVKMQPDGSALVGITDHAQEELGDIVYVNLPEKGDRAEAAAVLCDVESVKSDAEVYSPVNGAVEETNAALTDDPGLLNSDPYGAWIAKIGGASGAEELMDAAEYDAYLAAL